MSEYIVTVRYGRMGIIENFATALADLRAAERCVVATERGEDLGEILTPATELPAELPAGLLPRVVRRAHVTDVFSLERYQAEDAAAALETCAKIAAELGLDLNVVDAEAVQGGRRIVFYYSGKFGGDLAPLIERVSRRLRAAVAFSKASSTAKERTMLESVVEAQAQRVKGLAAKAAPGAGEVEGEGCGDPNCGHGSCGDEEGGAAGADGAGAGGGCKTCAVGDLTGNLAAKRAARAAGPRLVRWTELPEAAGLAPGEVLTVTESGESVALFNVDGALYALDNYCPHRNAPLGEGTLRGAIVTCPWHHWEFDVRTGAGPDGAAATWPVRTEGGRVWLGMPCAADAPGAVLLDPAPPREKKIAAQNPEPSEISPTA